jgi:predicted phosphodiesterase
MGASSFEHGGMEIERRENGMRIGVLLDTHLIEPNTRFKKMIEFHFKDAEEILHAGDFVDGCVAEYFSSLKELVVVCGNMHSEEKKMAADGRATLGILRLDQDIEGDIIQIQGWPVSLPG